MPSVRTASAPERVPNTMAMRMATGMQSHQGQPRDISVTAELPKMAIMYPAQPATVICTNETIPP